MCRKHFRGYAIQPNTVSALARAEISWLSAPPQAALATGADVMQYTKPMIDLVFEIRRNAPQAIKPEIKFTNPALMNTLAEMSETLEQCPLRAAVERLLSMVDDPRLAQPRPAKIEPVLSKPVEDKPVGDQPIQLRPEKVMMYRGRRVAS